ncbi:hypothetical protein KH990_01350 [Methanoculleus bourgensis]|jgi:hypothetical protein|uniref:Uncharacterized protein n=1 Tax=Methanoculleus bourgensis TaxID=83986 RepID=A0A0X3BJT6_9EURY|nr:MULTISPECIES: hypothetical protein [Methanoculleus]MBT0732025.1 hypothetical protein [Methanoculleus bourgensis]MDD3372367.1 hypothetical protein [Methanoculleus bourgensis]NMA87809.1 hypothetical protein [Methanoculleus bourgensis]NQS78470.1 hypothetical protein [Methanoculleus bourgensis]CVK31735.1 conserved protein of unknown function [Methanoculleus bourgensis]
MRCPACGFEDEGRYCSNCGGLLAGETKTAPAKGSWSDRCPVCRANPLAETMSRGFLGLTSREVYSCPGCGATFTPAGNGSFRFSGVADRSNPVWKNYGKQTLTGDEWRRIAYGGVSDARQRELDLEYALEKIQQGFVPELRVETNAVLLKRGERAVAVIPGVTLKEPRSVRTTYGGGAGPSFRIAKGVYFRTGGFAARSESHEEIKVIDSGTLTLTNRRMVFTGGKRTINFPLGKIVGMEPYRDGIAVNRDGKQRTEYYTGLDNVHLTIRVDDRSHVVPLSGMILMCMVQGLINSEE